MHFEERKYHLLQNITFNRDAPLEALKAHSYSFFLFLYFSVQDGGGFEVVCFFVYWFGVGFVGVLVFPFLLKLFKKLGNK